MLNPVKVLADTLTLESAIARVESQLKLDHVHVETTRLIGRGMFEIETQNFIHVYEWSHVTGTALVSSELLGRAA